MTDRDELMTLFDRANFDEQAVLLRIARQMMGKGRKDYGPLMLHGDSRSFTDEALPELADAVFYLATALEVLNRRATHRPNSP